MGRGGADMDVMPAALPLPPLPVLPGERVLLRASRDSDLEDRLRHPIDPEEEDGYGSGWRREWDGRRYHTREYLAAARRPAEHSAYDWAVEHDRHCVGSAALRVDAGQHRATYAVGLFVAALRGQGLGRQITRLVVAWGFGELGLHRIELEVLAFNARAIRCYLACGFRQEGVRREARTIPGRLERPDHHGSAALGIRALKARSEQCHVSAYAPAGRTQAPDASPVSIASSAPNPGQLKPGQARWRRLH